VSLIGWLIVFVLWSLSFLSFRSHGLFEAGIILLVCVLVTGALHLDCLADSVDAWLGGYGDQQRTLEIMKDPYSGPAGVVALVLVLLLKFSALIMIDWAVLLLAPVIARTGVMLLLATTPYARVGGLGDRAVKSIQKAAVWFVFLLIIHLSVFLLQENSWGLLVLFVIGLLLRQLMIKRISGTTGDTAGAMLEVMEVSTLLVFILLSSV